MILKTVNPVKDVVVVIDPGHGGSNKGANYNGVYEKSITMKTAQAMYDELSKYEGVKVHLTHTDIEQDMSLKERAEYAKSVNADYLVSLHFNASEEHSLYGCEVWVPSIGTYYTRGYQMGDKLIEELTKTGINSRGIKTKLGDDGDEYYGIIRECENRGISSVIVEHCHLDNYHDSKYWDEESDFVNFGKSDATAVARYLKLKSSTLGKDFTQEKNVSVSEPSKRIAQDTTPPKLHNVEITNYNENLGRLEFKIAAEDLDSGINYYSYSLDGGVTFSELYLWKAGVSGGEMNVVVDNLSRKNIELVVRVYNLYDVNVQSETKVIKSETGTDNKTGNDSGNISDNDSGAELNNTPDDSTDNIIDDETESQTESLQVVDDTPVGSDKLNLKADIVLIVLSILIVVSIVVSIRYINRLRRRKARKQREANRKRRN